MNENYKASRMSSHLERGRGCVINMKRTIIPYNPRLKLLARELRNNSTLGEIILWKKLKGKTFFGYDFHRQKPLLEYIVDFYCAGLRLVIEIDGQSHDHPDVYTEDLRRQQELEKYDLRFLRFTEKEIRTQLVNVLRAIEIFIEEFEEHTPGLLQQAQDRLSQEGNEELTT